MTDTLPAETAPTELPPENVPDLVRQSCRMLWEGNDVEPGISAKFSELVGARAEDAYQAGVDAAITVWVRLIPGPSPTDGVHFAVEQLWTHQRFLLGHLINISKKLADFEATLEKYRPMLPKPGSLAARAGAWGARRDGRA